jgi:uncharacterized protein (DUF1499 family)
MNKSQIFFTFTEHSKLEKVISSIPGDDFTIKIRKYMTVRAQQFINHHNKNLEYKDFEIYRNEFLPSNMKNKYLFAIILTKTNYNHPYLMFLNLDDNYITFLIPFGKDSKQADIEIFESAIEESNLAELTALYTLLDRTINIRKKGILNSKQFSLTECSNISNCIKKYHEIDKMNINPNDKLELKTRYREFYQDKALDFLIYYFKLLNNKQYDEAWEFLKGDNGKYSGKQRLNTFFKNTKSIIGHLEIFITLHEVFHSIRKKLFGL